MRVYEIPLFRRYDSLLGEIESFVLRIFFDLSDMLTNFFAVSTNPLLVAILLRNSEIANTILEALNTWSHSLFFTQMNI